MSAKGMFSNHKSWI